MVQASPEAYSHRADVSQSRSITEGTQLQQNANLGQPRGRTLMAHGKDSFVNPSDVPDMEEMAASPQNVLAHASLTNTSRGVKGHEGDDKT